MIENTLGTQQESNENIRSYMKTTLYINQKQRTVIANVYATGQQYIFGPSNQYCSSYPQNLSGYITQEEYQQFIKEVNKSISRYWPCTFTFIIAYACCILTCCISLFLPKICIDDVSKYLYICLEKWNKIFNSRGILVDFKRTCIETRLEFSVANNLVKECQSKQEYEQKQQKQLQNQSQYTRAPNDEDDIELVVVD